MYPNIKTQIKKHSSQAIQMLGINLTDNYKDGQMESCGGISTARYPYITTAQNLQPVDTGIPDGYHAIAMFAWDKLFVVSDEPSGNGGYKCYYDGIYCGDAANLDVPKQFAVVNSKLVMFPDKVMFQNSENGITSTSLTTATVLRRISSGTVEYRKAVE